jgi:hypothetical protein
MLTCFTSTKVQILTPEAVLQEEEEEERGTHKKNVC